MRVNLELDKHQVIEAQTGREGLCKVEQERPDVVLLDVLMPEMDGAQACEQLKKQQRTRNIPILLFGALTTEEMYHRAPHADRYLELPFEPIKLVATVNGLAA
jgi:CheY-like chemotaxis protein